MMGLKLMSKHCAVLKNAGLAKVLVSLSIVKELFYELGTDKNGYQHYMIFGLRFPKDDNEQTEAIYREILEVITYAASR